MERSAAERNKKAPYGYRNIRVEKRGLVEVHPVNGTKVTKLFELYAYHHLTLDSLQERLYQEGIHYSDSVPRFPRSKLYAISGIVHTSGK